MSLPKLPTTYYELPRQGREGGFSLIEMMIVVAILIILTGIAVPAYVNMVANMRVRTATSDFVSDLAYARAEAVKRSARVGVARPNDEWQGGWVVFIDAGKDGYTAGDALLKAVHSPLDGSTVSAGSVTSGAGAIKMCSKASASAAASANVSADAITFGGDGRLRVYLGTTEKTSDVGGIGITSPKGSDVGGSRLVVFGPTGRVSVDTKVAAADKCT